MSTNLENISLSNDKIKENDNNNVNIINNSIEHIQNTKHNDSDSDDDEYYLNHGPLTVDHTELSGIKKFSFYNFGEASESFDDILHNIKTYSNSFQNMSNYYQNSIKNKELVNTYEYKKFSIKEFQRTKLYSTRNKNYTISQFKEKQLIWDASAPDKELLNTLYRKPQSDPSGTCIMNLSRDLAKGVPAWKPSECDRQFSYPDANSYADSFKKQLIKHMERVVKQVESEYIKLPERTQEQSKVKANVGADLANLKRKQENILSVLKNQSLS